MGIRKEIREGKDMKESEQIYANLNMKKTGEISVAGVKDWG